MTNNEIKLRISEIDAEYKKIYGENLGYAKFWEKWKPLYEERQTLENALKNSQETNAARAARLSRHAEIMVEVERQNRICNDDGNSPYGL